MSRNGTRSPLWRHADRIALVVLGLILVCVLGLQMVVQAHIAVEHDLQQAPTYAEEPGDVAIGPPDSPLILVFVSATCVHCRAWEAREFPRLRQWVREGGHARLVLRQFPLDGQALHAAALLACLDPGPRAMVQENLAAASVLSWTSDSGLLTSSGLTGVAGQQALSCASSEATTASIMASRQEATSDWGVLATPTFIVGRHVMPGEQSALRLQAMAEAQGTASGQKEGRP